jgi:hypothetical protein
MTKKDASGQRRIIPMEESDFYKNDDLGLKTLKEQNKLAIVHIDGQHTEYKEEHINQFFIPFLKK